jgi:hypothetical protein
MSMTPVFADEAAQQPSRPVRFGLKPTMYEAIKQAPSYHVMQGAEISDMVVNSIKPDAVGFRTAQLQDPLLWS